MSTSIIDDYNMSNHPTNYLEYIDGDKQFGKLKSGDWIKYFTYEDVDGNTHEVQMYDIYSFEDVKFSIKPNSTIVFMVDRAHSKELVPISIIASSFSTY